VRKGAEVLVGVFAAPAAAEGALPAATETPHTVEIAVLTGCPFSQRAQRLLRTLGIPHEVHVVRSAEERAAVEHRSGRSTLPQVFIDGQAIGGYDALADLHGEGALEPLRAG
jgi:glutaredoxin